MTGAAPSRVRLDRPENGAVALERDGIDDYVCPSAEETEKLLRGRAVVMAMGRQVDANPIAVRDAAEDARAKFGCKGLDLLLNKSPAATMPNMGNNDPR